jgi:hypothetical protein
MNGIVSGLVTDSLAYGMSALVSDIAEINTWEVLDYGFYQGLEAVKMLGFGFRPAEMAGETYTLRICWGGCARY